MRISYLNFISECQSSVRDSHIVCWYNIEEGFNDQKLFDFNSLLEGYLSGNMLEVEEVSKVAKYHKRACFSKYSWRINNVPNVHATRSRYIYWRRY